MATITNSLCTSNKAIPLQSNGGALKIGTSAVATNLTIGNVTGATSIVINAGTASSSFNTTNGSFTLTTGTGTISIGTDATNKTINIGAGNSTGNFNIQTGTGSITLSANGGTVIGHRFTSPVYIGAGTSGTGGTITLNSKNSAINFIPGTGAINIGTDSTSKNIVIGSTNSGTNIFVNKGSTGAATSFNSGISTNPINSSSATSGFGSSLTAGTAFQNTSGSNLLVNVCVRVNSATSATILVGVANSASPTGTTIIPTFSTAVSASYTFSVIVPINYYIRVSTTGTISISLIRVQACAF